MVSASMPRLGEPFFFSSDHIAAVNRIKPHTDFDGEIESGLSKMMVIGLGKHTGAIHYHRANIRYGYYTVITSVAEVVKKYCKILFGLGIVENAYDETFLIEEILCPDIGHRERQLLQIAQSSLARIPFYQ